MNEDPGMSDTHIFEFVFYNCVDKCGNSYPTVKIGSKIWMAKNLNCETETGSWVYNNDANNAGTYGRLYTWAKAIENAPEGWHLPTSDEWKQLVDSTLNSTDEENAIAPLKTSQGWNPMGEISGNGTNASGFSALPGGIRNAANNTFDLSGNSGYWWTSTAIDDANAQFWRLTRYNSSVIRANSEKGNGLSVRYIKDSEK
jgi:uncharacterized protein (TIGR02145 family)